MEGEYDAIHFHFPEYLTYEIESACRESLGCSLIDQIEERLKYWSDRSALVFTRHNLLPHDKCSDPQWKRLYETVYRYVDGVVHFAEPSIDEFRERYTKVDFIHDHPKHFDQRNPWTGIHAAISRTCIPVHGFL